MLDEIQIPGSTPEQDEKIVSALDGALSALATLAGTRTVEVDLPILKVKAYVKPVNGSEELRLRTMKASGAAFIKSFNKVIFEHVNFEGIKFDDFEDFQNNLSPADKNILVYALLDSTFTKLPEKIITCPSCGQVDTHNPEPSKIFHSDSISKVWEHEEESSEYMVKSTIVDGFDVMYAMPSETDRLLVIESKENSELRDELEETDDILSPIELFSVYIKQINIKQGDTLFELTDKVKEILPLLKDMPMELKSKLLSDETVSEFIDYNPKFYLNITCSNIACKQKEFKWDNINPEQDFFLKALSVYN